MRISGVFVCVKFELRFQRANNCFAFRRAFLSRNRFAKLLDTRKDSRWFARSHWMMPRLFELAQVHRLPTRTGFNSNAPLSRTFKTGSSGGRIPCSSIILVFPSFHRVQKIRMSGRTLSSTRPMARKKTPTRIKSSTSVF